MLNAMEACARGVTVAPLFESVSLVERRSLRLMLERRHVEERDLVGDEALMTPRALPVYEVHCPRLPMMLVKRGG